MLSCHGFGWTVSTPLRNHFWFYDAILTFNANAMRRDFGYGLALICIRYSSERNIPIIAYLFKLFLSSFFLSIPVNALRREKKQTRARKPHICAYVWLFGYFPIVVNFFMIPKTQFDFASLLDFFSLHFTHTRPISNKQRKFQPK